MAAISTRSELKAYCLRRLGAPVIQINVSDDQVEDRLDDAFDFFNEFHWDSTARIFHKHQITQEDKDNQYINIPAEITHIKRILPLQGGGLNATGIFDPVYQMHQNDFLSFNHVGSSMQYWNQWQSHLKMIQMQTSGTQQEIDFTRYEHQLRIRVNWETDVSVGDWIVIDAERLLLPGGYGMTDDGSSPSIETVSDVYNDQFVKEYATAMIKQQWGENLSKFEGIQMPGGVTFSGDRIRQEARDDIARIREEARQVWEQPLGLYIG